jgi:hypothetical protein
VLCSIFKMFCPAIISNIYPTTHNLRQSDQRLNFVIDEIGTEQKVDHRLFKLSRERIVSDLGSRQIRYLGLIRIGRRSFV